MKGLLCDVLRPAHGADCTAKGITSRCTQVLVVGEGVPALFEAGPDVPVVRLVRRNIGGSDYMHVEPIEKPSGCNGPMMGGNFIYSCDSRFRALAQYPLPVHDRFEKW